MYYIEQPWDIVGIINIVQNTRNTTKTLAQSDRSTPGKMICILWGRLHPDILPNDQKVTIDLSCYGNYIM